MTQNNGGPAGTGSTTGMAPNLAAALSYVLGLITGIIFFVLEKENQFVRFHAMQSILFSVAWIVIWIALSIIETILGFIPIIGFLAAVLGLLISLGLGLGGFILWIILIIKAYSGDKFKLPYIGDMAERYANQ